MKKVLSIVWLFFTVSSASVFGQGFQGTDKSPMDMAYFPDNFAHDRKGDEKAIIRVTYSRPAKNGREVFGKLIPYGKVWRTGANEATEIKIYQDVTVNGKALKAGTYSLFTIPGESEWTIIFNSDLDYWGSYSYKESSDVLRVTATAKKIGETIEAFSIQFAKAGNNGATMLIGWDKTVAEVPFQFE